MFTCLQLAKAQPTVRKGVAQCARAPTEVDSSPLDRSDAPIRSGTPALVGLLCFHRNVVASPLADRSHCQARDLKPTQWRDGLDTIENFRLPRQAVEEKTDILTKITDGIKISYEELPGKNLRLKAENLFNDVTMGAFMYMYMIQERIYYLVYPEQ
ncbi:unnamed protein product [Arctogadus glacialis]